MSIAGHVSRKMLNHYSHIRLAAKRKALDQLSARSPHPQPTYATNAGLDRGDGPYVLEKMVDLSGIEPLASSLRTRRSPS